MASAIRLSPMPALRDPARDGGLVRAGLYAELGHGEVAGFVQVALVTADGDACGLGKQVAASGCQLR